MDGFKYVSLFSGIGGFEQALNKLGGSCVLASEIDKFANQSYEVLYGEPTVGDITKIDAKDVPDHDMLVGGFPCQAFSVAGKRGGFDDARGTLFFEMARIAAEKQPKVILAENVKGLVGHLSKSDYEGAVKYQLEKGEIFWGNESSQRNKSDIVKRNVTNYLREKLASELDLQINKSTTSYKNTQDFTIEEAENYLRYGLTKNLKSLETQISQTMRKLRESQDEQIQRFVCNGEDLVLNLNQLYSIENLKVTDTTILDEMESTSREVELRWRSLSAEISKKGKSFTTSTDEKMMIKLRTFTYAVIQANIIVSIIKPSFLSESLLKKVLSDLTKKTEFTYTIPTLDVIVTTLNEIGYRVDFDVLNSKYFGVPQNRERIFIVAIREDLIENEPWHIEGTTVVPKGKRRISGYDDVKTFNFDFPSDDNVTTRLRDILETDVDEKYYLSEEKTAKLVAKLEDSGEPQLHCDLKMLGHADIKGHDFNKRIYSVDGVSRTLNTASDIGRSVKVAEPQMLGHINIKGHDAIKRVYGSEGIAPTLTTMGGGHREPKIAERKQAYRIRKLTPLECWRLQGFPDEAHEAVKQAVISDSQRYKQAGNAVTVNVIQAIGERLLAYL